MKKEIIQPELNFDSGDENGYRNFQKQQIEKLNQIKKEWSVPINEKVRMSFLSIQGEYTGHLILLETPDKINKKKYGPLKLRLNFHEKDFALGESKFDYIDFESNQMGKCKVIKNK